jgi:hypothetical protein
MLYLIYKYLIYKINSWCGVSTGTVFFIAAKSSLSDRANIWETLSLQSIFEHLHQWFPGQETITPSSTGSFASAEEAVTDLEIKRLHLLSPA